MSKKQKTEVPWTPASVKLLDNPFQYASSTYHTTIPEEIIKNGEDPVCLGVDEAGRGPVLGPMVYGIAYCLELYHNKIKQFGFADSKVLKDDVRRTLLQSMEEKDHELLKNIGWATRTLTARDILSGMLRPNNVGGGPGVYNLNEQAHDATIQLVSEVLKSGVKVTLLFVDTVGPPVSYQAKLRKQFPQIDDIVVAKKADSIYPIVSAASVVAKVTRDMNLEFYRDNMAILLGQLLGSGYPSDPNTSKWLNGHVDPVFGWHFGLIRFSWQTAKDSLVKNNAADVIYELECVKDGGYGDVDDMFRKELSAVEFYGVSATM